MTLRVEEFQGSAAEWDAFVRTQPGWTHFHLYGWRTVVERTFGHDCPFLAARDEAGALVGVLPLVRVKSLIFGHYLVSMPFLNYGGPLGSAAAVAGLAAYAIDLARRGNVKLLELRSRTPLAIDMPVSHRKVTVLLDLKAGDPDGVFQALPGRMKSYIRKTQKAGVTVRFGPAEMDGFYAVFAQHMHELGTPTHARALFDAIADVFPADSWFGTAYLDGRPVACGAGLEWDGEVEMTWASSLTLPEIRPNLVLYWAFIERAAQQGLRVFNFGRSTPGSGTHEFKRRWGSRDQELWWYGLSPKPGATTPSPKEGAFSWGPRIWKRLPRVLASALGPSVVRWIP